MLGERCGGKAKAALGLPSGGAPVAGPCGPAVHQAADGGFVALKQEQVWVFGERGRSSRKQWCDMRLGR